MKDRYLVLGNPIEHSLSPDIHTRFANQTGEPIEYERRLIEIGDFDPAVRRMQQQGILGANVTVPFKEVAFAMADEHSARSQQAGAANTLVFKDDGIIYADNTDGTGLVNDIKINHQRSLKAKKILILGAGGAVRGVMQPLIDERPASITIANRTVEKAEVIRDIYRDAFPIVAGDFQQLVDQRFDVVINGTSLGLQGKVVPLPAGIFAKSALAYDMMYGTGSLPFQQWAKQQGVELVLDGLGMLVGQAAESFFVWRGVRPDASAVIDAMRLG